MYGTLHHKAITYKTRLMPCNLFCVLSEEFVKEKIYSNHVMCMVPFLRKTYAAVLS